MIRSLDSSVPHALVSPKRGAGLEVELATDHISMGKSR